MTAPHDATAADAVGRTDLWIVVGLTFATALYVVAWPHDLFRADEGLFLYEAKRILNGDLIYRDFFEVITPLSLYVMAGLFWAFGVSMETARLSNAGLHTLIVLAVYFTCRRLGIRPLVALVAGVGHVAIGYPAWPITSPHWLGTLLTLVILWLIVGLATPPRGWRVALVGFVCGMLIAAQHQKGVIITAGVSLVIALDALAEGAVGSTSRTVRRLMWLWAGAALAVIPMLIVLVGTAGFDRVYEGLVRFPLEYYPAYNRTTWGAYALKQPKRYSLLAMIRFLPVVVPFTILHWGWARWRGAPPYRVRQLMVSSIIAAATVASILYFPDYIHLAIIAPVMLVLAADMLEGALRAMERRLRGSKRAGAVACLVLCVLAGRHAYRNAVTRWTLYPYSHLTAFGRVDFRSQLEIALVDKIRDLTREASWRELFCYTSCPGLYLTTDTENATPYQLMIPGYNQDWQMADVTEILERRAVPYVVVIRVAMKGRIDDPIFEYVSSHYSPVGFWPQPQLVYGLYKRKP